MDQEKKYTLVQALVGECFGCFLLTFVDGVLPLTDQVGVGSYGLTGKVLGGTAVVMSLIFYLGQVSGAHINPAVTLAFALRKVFPKKKTFLYITVQLLGAIGAGFLIHYLFGAGMEESLSRPIRGDFLAIVFESIVSCVLIITVLTTSCEAHIKGWESAFPVGFTLLFGGFICKDISGASFNPAKSFGLALGAGNFHAFYIYLFPFVGALMGVALTFLLVGRPNAKELKAAKGNS